MPIKHDWRNLLPSGFSYKSITDPQYIKERDELFAKNGNGWWINSRVKKTVKENKEYVKIRTRKRNKKT
ncbi:MAG: hypothetical protein H8E98_02595 [Bacteroidetes bacterium]|nr:hypothetical protein [Bacteroidota bacterium]